MEIGDSVTLTITNLGNYRTEHAFSRQRDKKRINCLGYELLCLGLRDLHNAEDDTHIHCHCGHDIPNPVFVPVKRRSFEVSYYLDLVTSMASKENQLPLPPWGSALAGATGAVLANAIVYPLDM